MSAQDQLKLDVMGKVVSGVFDREKACLILDISQRTIRRYLKAYMDKGPLFVKHGNYQRSPANKSSKELKNKVLSLGDCKLFCVNGVINVL